MAPNSLEALRSKLISFLTNRNANCIYQANMPKYQTKDLVSVLGTIRSTPVTNDILFRESLLNILQNKVVPLKVIENSTVEYEVYSAFGTPLFFQDSELTYKITMTIIFGIIYNQHKEIDSVVFTYLDTGRISK